MYSNVYGADGVAKLVDMMKDEIIADPNNLVSRLWVILHQPLWISSGYCGIFTRWAIRRWKWCGDWIAGYVRGEGGFWSDFYLYIRFLQYNIGYEIT